MGRRKNKEKNKGVVEEAAPLLLTPELIDNDIWGEVLSRLDIPSLFKLKSVSKGFRNFIERPEFGALYHRRGRAVAGKGLTGLFFQQKKPLWKIMSMDTYFYGCAVWQWCKDMIRFDQVEPEAGRLPDPKLKLLTIGSGDLSIVDSCNGLLLAIFKEKLNEVKYRRHMFVCNPCTKEKVSIPLPGKQPGGIFYALAADLYEHYLKYKVVCVRTKKGGNTILSVFCSETGEWTQVCDDLPPTNFDLSHHLSMYGSRVFFNGSLYWDCIRGHILVLHLDPAKNRPCYDLIEAPAVVPTIGRRSLWKSEDKLHCYCHGFDTEFAGMTLSFDKGRPEWDSESSDCDLFENLIEDLRNKKRYKNGDVVEVITYDPKSDTIFFLISRGNVGSYRCSERLLHLIGSYHGQKNNEGRVFPYTHSLVQIQTVKEAMDVTAADTQGRDDSEKVRGGRNRRTPRCPDFSIDDQLLDLHLF